MRHKTDTRRVMGVEELRGKTVLRRETAEKLGEVTDVIVDPAGGRVLGLTVKGPGGETTGLATPNVLIGADAVMASAVEGLDAQSTEELLQGGILASRDLAGAVIVTENGQVLGRIAEVLVSLEHPRVLYRVAESTIQRFLGGGFYVSGDLPSTYSPEGPRMIVPADTERFAASTLEELIGPAPDAVEEP